MDAVPLESIYSPLSTFLSEQNKSDPMGGAKGSMEVGPRFIPATRGRRIFNWPFGRKFGD